MRARAVVSVLLSVMLIAAGPAAAAKKGLRLTEHVSKDPVLAWILTVDDLATTYDGILQFVNRVADEVEVDTFDAKLVEFEATVGCSVRDDLLAQIGPEVGLVLDLPPIDALVAQIGADPLNGLPATLGKLGMMATVQDPARLDGCLRKLFTSGDGMVSDEDGIVRVLFDTSDGEGEEGSSGFGVYYGFQGGVMAFGVSSDFVRSSLEPRAKGERLTDGGDFVRVFAHLDKQPQMLTYVNVPRIGEMVTESQMLKVLIDATPQAREIVDMLLQPELTGMGIGATSIEIDGGTRQTTFGPSALTGGAMYAGIIAAVAIPNLLSAIDRGKQKRTIADIRSAGTACEVFAIDTNKYPGPTDGFVPIAEIAESLEPVYIRTLPRVDGWDNPILYWSDGQSFRIVSHGKGGTADGDWTGEIESGPTFQIDADIVFADGAFVVWPEGTLQ